VIAFGGRALDAGQQPKYLNSPEVAPLGTALTADQLKMLWRMVPEPVLCFDGDGQKAAHRAVETGRALDRETLHHELQRTGHAGTVARIGEAIMRGLDLDVCPGASREDVQRGWHERLAMQRKAVELPAELEAAERGLAASSPSSNISACWTSTRSYMPPATAPSRRPLPGAAVSRLVGLQITVLRSLFMFPFPGRRPRDRTRPRPQLVLADEALDELRAGRRRVAEPFGFRPHRSGQAAFPHPADSRFHCLRHYSCVVSAFRRILG
jgi:hypothetical protein